MAQGLEPGSRDLQWNEAGSGFDSRLDGIGCGHGLQIPGWRPRDYGISRQSRQ